MGDYPVSVSPQWFISNAHGVKALRLVDVRKMPAFEQSGKMIPGATWRDYALVETWAGQYDPDDSILVYCVHGHEVSQNTVSSLLSMGYRAQFLEGGFDAWLEAGGDAIEPEGQAVLKGADNGTIK